MYWRYITIVLFEFTIILLSLAYRESITSAWRLTLSLCYQLKLHAYIHTHTHTDRQADRQTDRQTDRQKDRKTHTDRQRDRHTHRTNRQTDRQTDIHTCTFIPYVFLSEEKLKNLTGHQSTELITIIQAGYHLKAYYPWQNVPDECKQS